MSTSEHQSLYREVKAKIVVELEEGRLPWVSSNDLPSRGKPDRVARIMWPAAGLVDTEMRCL